MPNGLLEALGDSCFLPDGFKKHIHVAGVPPLVIITSNNERLMPDTFIRRCLVLNLTLPKGRDELIDIFIKRGEAHFPDLDKDILLSAAALVAADRERAKKANHRPLPGQAEYIDLLRAVSEQSQNSKEQEKILNTVKQYVVSKTLAPA